MAFLPSTPKTTRGKWTFHSRCHTVLSGGHALPCMPRLLSTRPPAPALPCIRPIVHFHFHFPFHLSTCRRTQSNSPSRCRIFKRGLRHCSASGSLTTLPTFHPWMMIDQGQQNRSSQPTLALCASLPRSLPRHPSLPANSLCPPSSSRQACVVRHIDHPIPSTLV